MSLLERFRQDSDHTGDGHFTLDEKRARTKMARFQLTKLEEFLLLLVQALVAARCEELSIDVETDSESDQMDVLVKASKVELDPAKLSNLEDYFFRREVSSASYNLLSIAINSVEASCVEPPQISQTSEGEIALLFRLKRGLPRLEEVVKAKARYCPCSLTLNGTELAQEPIEGELKIEIVEGYESWVKLVRYGVLVEHQRIQGVPAFQAFLERPTFQLDASFSHIVRDQVYDDAISTVQQRANHLVAEMAQRCSPSDHKRLRRWLLEVREDPAATALRVAPVFAMADSEKFCSWSDLEAERVKSSQLLTSNSRLNLSLGQPVVLISAPEVQTTLQRLFPGPDVLQDAGPVYRRRLQAKQNRELWENTPRPTELPPGEYFGRERIATSDWQAEIGFSRSPGGRQLDVLYRGKLLGTETLPETLPPGAQAVINFEEATIDDMWRRVMGRSFRSALAELEKRFESLFRNLPGLKREELFPELEEYLLNDLPYRADYVPDVFCQTPLFATFEADHWMSLADLKAHSVVSLGPELVLLSPDFPRDLIPEPYLPFSPKTMQVLSDHLGPARTLDFRGKAERYQRLDEQLRAPLRPVVVSENILLKRSYNEDGVCGEFAIVEELGTSVSVAFHYRGVLLEERSVSLTRVLQGRVVLSSDELQPDEAWEGLERTPHLDSLLSLSRRKLEGLERELLQQGTLRPAVTMKLLLAYPDHTPNCMDLPLFRNHRATYHYSLNELQAELDREGHLLYGSSPIDSGKRVVLEAASEIRLKLLRQVFGEDLELKRADLHLAKERRVEEFLARQRCQKVVLSKRFQAKAPSLVGEGEIGVIRVDGSESGSVFCYIDDRFAGVLPKVLPPHCAAALQHPELVHNEDFSEILFPPKLLDQIRDQCSCEMAKFLGSDEDMIRSASFAHFQEVPVKKDLRAELMMLPFVDLYGGGKTTLRKLQDQHPKSLPYVTRKFELTVPVPKPVLRYSEVEMRVLARFCQPRRRIRNVEDELLRKHRNQAYLQSLPTTVPADLEPREVKSTSLRATIAVSGSEESLVVGLDENGKAMGYADWAGLAVVAVVKGLTPASKKKTSKPAVGYTGKSKKEFGELVDRVYLGWCRDLDRKALSEERRRIALTTLWHTMRLLGSNTQIPQAEMASILWDLPLFQRVDGTWVSGTALSVQLSDSEEPLVLAPTSLMVPGEVLLVDEGSLEFIILRSVLGKSSLVWYERPPLIDPEQLKESVQRITTWGLAPLRKLDRGFEKIRDRYHKFAGSLRSKQKKGALSAAQREQRLLDELHTDLGLLLGRRSLQKADTFFSNTEFGSWILGPPIYRSMTTEQIRFNRLHPAFRWLLSAEGSSRSRRIARLLLLVNWVGLVNEASIPLTDEDEDHFLSRLLKRLLATFR